MLISKICRYVQDFIVTMLIAQYKLEVTLNVKIYVLNH